MWDFASVYSASRTWIHGGDPYDLPSVLATWHGMGPFSNRDVGYFATVYPPNSLIVLAPFAALPLCAAMLAWLALTLTLLALQLAALADLAGLEWRDPRALLLFAASLASAPFQFGILAGQLSLPAISGCILALWCASRRREVLAGLLLGLACATKPQVAAPFLLYYLLCRRWWVGGVAIFLSGTIFAAALVAMRMSHIDWLNGWERSIAITTRMGGVNDYGWAGDYRDEIMDMKILLVSVFHNSNLLRIAVDCMVLVLVVLYLRVFRRAPANDLDELIMIAGLTALSLLPMYHRVYDAALLTTGFAWALAQIYGPLRRYAVAMLFPMAIFLVPFDFTSTLGRHIRGFAVIARSSGWQAVIAPHYGWGLLVLAIIIIWAVSARSADQSEAERIR
jgi:hypothetical protein